MQTAPCLWVTLRGERSCVVLVHVNQILTVELYVIKLLIALADTFPCRFPDIVQLRSDCL